MLGAWKLLPLARRFGALAMIESLHLYTVAAVLAWRWDFYYCCYSFESTIFDLYRPFLPHSHRHSHCSPGLLRRRRRQVSVLLVVAVQAAAAILRESVVTLERQLWYYCD